MPTEYIGTSEAGRRLGLSPRQVRRWLEDGRILGRKVGENGHWRVEWDIDLMGASQLAPVNKFIKKNCIRHGGSIISNVDWDDVGIGKRLEIKVHGVNRQDCIDALRKISGGMTMEELANNGVCTQCEGYEWHDDVTLRTRRTVHGRRKKLEYEDDPETVKLLREIAELMERQPAQQPIFVPTPYIVPQSPETTTPWYIQDGSTTDTVTTPSWTYNRPVTAQLNYSTTSATSVPSEPTEGYISVTIPPEALVPSEEPIVSTAGIVYIPMNTERVGEQETLVVGQVLTADQIQARLSPTQEEGAGAYIEITQEGFRIHGIFRSADDFVDVDYETATPEEEVLPPAATGGGGHAINLGTIFNRFPRSEWSSRVRSYMINQMNVGLTETRIMSLHGLTDVDFVEGMNVTGVIHDGELFVQSYSEPNETELTNHRGHVALQFDTEGARPPLDTSRATLQVQHDDDEEILDDDDIELEELDED